MSGVDDDDVGVVEDEDDVKAVEDEAAVVVDKPDREVNLVVASVLIAACCAPANKFFVVLVVILWCVVTFAAKLNTELVIVKTPLHK